MTISESNIQLVRDWVEIGWNQGNTDRLTEFLAPTFMNEGKPATIDVLIQFNRQQQATFQDLRYVIEDIFANEVRVCFRWTATGLHVGMLWGFIPPSNKHVSWSGIHMLRITDQRITEIWATSTMVTMLQQIGVTLQPPAS